MAKVKKNLISQQANTLIADCVREFILSVRVANRSERTVEFYQTNLRRFCWWLRKGDYPEKLSEIAAVHIRLFLVYLKENGHRWHSDKPQSNKPLKDTSVRAYFRALQTFFNWAAREEFIAESPFRNRRIQCPSAKSTLIPSYSTEELVELIDACRTYDSPNRLRDLAIIYLLLDTGIRATELCELELAGNVEELKRGRLKVCGKGNRERYVAVSLETQKVIRDYIRKERPDGGETIFCGKGTAPLTRNGLYQAIERLCSRAGVEQSGVHRFRHTFALQWSRSGGPLQALQTLLGHSSPIMSMKYGRMASEEAAQLHKLHSPVERLKKRR